jgi:hypothetical protein
MKTNSKQTKQNKTNKTTKIVWSFGLLIYSLCSMKLPYSHLSKVDAVKDLINGALPSFPTQATQYETLGKLYKQCCEISPTKRPLSGDLPSKLSSLSQDN